MSDSLRSRMFRAGKQIVAALLRPSTTGSATRGTKDRDGSRSTARPGPTPEAPASRSGGTEARPAPRPRGTTRPAPPAAHGTVGAGYPGDFTGTVRPSYAPRPDGAPDPGEIVWTWVPYEEDHSQGKDRPVLLVGRDGDWLLGLMLTSKDHSRDAADEARHGRHWLDIGTGPWDSKGRPSEVRLDRVLRIDPAAVRREGAVMTESVFDTVVAGMRS